VSVSERYQTISAWPPRFARPTASINGWGAVAWSRQTGFDEATPRRAVEIYDRVGGWRQLPSGLLYLADLQRSQPKLRSDI
jgi:hypothetical protein